MKKEKIYTGVKEKVYTGVYDSDLRSWLRQGADDVFYQLAIMAGKNPKDTATYKFLNPPKRK